MGKYLNPVLLLLFAGSGCAALIYEVVWLQLLQLVIGSTALSMAVLLGTFMGGMCLGSLALTRAVPRHWHPLRVFAALEAGTGLCGFASIFGLPLAGVPWRGVACTLLLLPPTVMMGATLPVMARLLESRRLGFFYGANIAGGVLGCLLAGFWLLPAFDMTVATCVAVSVNMAVAAVSLGMSFVTPYTEPGAGTPWVRKHLAGTSLTGEGVAGVYLAIALSGLCALGAEVVWTRLLALTLGPTVYTFSIILAVFLAGMGLGSGAASWLLAKRLASPRVPLAICQMLLTLCVAWAGYMIASRLPYWEKNLSMQAEPWKGFLFDLGCCAAALLPAAILWGASFPFAMAALGADAVGAVYAANTAGGIVGAVLFSLVVIPSEGSQNAERALVVLCGLAAVSALPRPKRLLAAIAIAVIVCAAAVPAIPWKLIAFGRRLPMETGPWKNLYTAEGMNSSIAYSEWVDKRRFFHVAGKVEASSTPADMRLQRMLGHLPGLLHPDPRSVLIVGCGAGVTAGAFVVHPEVQRIALCEIEPLIPPASARFFGQENHGVIHDRRTRVVFDDARHYILTAEEKFDIITSDPIHPWVKGAATLYSKEYFELCRAHLKPGGFVTQWVPLYSSDFATVKSEIATFFEVFPHAVVWGNMDDFQQGYDVVLLGSAEAIAIDVDAVQSRLARAPALAASLKEVGFRSAADLLGTYASRPAELKEWLRGAQINRDSSLRLQYLAGRALNVSLAGAIYGQMEKRSPFPEDLFYGSAQGRAAVRNAFREWRADPF